MLSEDERKALREIERGLATDHPDMASSLVDAFDRVPRLWPYTVIVAIGAVLAVLGILLAQPGLVLLGVVPALTAAGARWAAWKRWHEGSD